MRRYRSHTRGCPACDALWELLERLFFNFSWIFLFELTCCAILFAILKMIIDYYDGDLKISYDSFIFINGVLLLCLSFFTMILCVWYFKKYRIMEDTAISKNISSAPQGYVELHCYPDYINETLVTPISHKPCVWYRYRLVADFGKSYKLFFKNDRYPVLEEGESFEPIILKDNTGFCIVDTFHHNTFFHNQNSVMKPLQNEKFKSEATGITYYPDNYEYMEDYLDTKCKIYVIGMFKTISLNELEDYIRNHPKARDWRDVLHYIEKVKDKDPKFDVNTQIHLISCKGLPSRLPFVVSKQAPKMQVTHIKLATLGVLIVTFASLATGLSIIL